MSGQWRSEERGDNKRVTVTLRCPATAESDQTIHPSVRLLRFALARHAPFQKHSWQNNTQRPCPTKLANTNCCHHKTLHPCSHSPLRVLRHVTHEKNAWKRVGPINDVMRRVSEPGILIVIMTRLIDVSSWDWSHRLTSHHISISSASQAEAFLPHMPCCPRRSLR